MDSTSWTSSSSPTAAGSVVVRGHATSRRLNAPGVADVPVTHREHASSLTIVTGHEDPTKPESALDWEALAAQVRAGGTLAILMGVGRLPDNVAALREAGLAPETPAAMVERATLPDEQVVTGTLATIVSVASGAGIEPPAVTVVGDVVEVRARVRENLGAAGAADDGPAATPTWSASDAD